MFQSVLSCPGKRRWLSFRCERPKCQTQRPRCEQLEARCQPAAFTFSTGDPNGQGLPAWPQYRDKKTGRAMILGDKVEGESAPDTARLALYDAMFLRQLTATKTH